MFVEFEMERLQSLYENEVKYNLSDSGNHPLSMKDLLSDDEINKILEMEIYAIPLVTQSSYLPFHLGIQIKLMRAIFLLPMALLKPTS